VFTAIMLAQPESALALPSGTPDNTPMVDGRVRAIEQVGTNIWVGGRFSRVEQRNGTLLGSVANMAVFDSKTNKYKNIAPKIGGTDSEVFDMTLYGKNVLIAGNFPGPTTNKSNLVLVDGVTGKVIRWYNSPSLKSVLGAPKLGRLYGGGVSLSAYEFSTGKKLWTKAKTEVEVMRSHDSKPAYRDLELDADGKTIWAACICDKVGGKAAKALVKLDTDGNHASSWRAAADRGSWGMSVAQANGALYLGAGGSDYLAKFSKANGGNPNWLRDTSGSVQVVEVMDSQLVIGGHFWEVADRLSDQPLDMVDKCGHGRSGDVDQNGIPTLDPNGKCETRKGIAAYSFEGKLDPWSPTYAGKYSLVWALHVAETDETRLHTGGEFLTVNGVTQNYYARLSPTGP
jgi:hypothetical protein